MPKTLYLSPRELATVVDTLTLYAGELETRAHRPHRRRSSIRRHFGRLRPPRRSDTDTYDADRLRDQWYAHLRPDLTNPPAKTEAKP